MTKRNHTARKVGKIMSLMSASDLLAINEDTRGAWIMMAGRPVKVDFSQAKAASKRMTPLSQNLSVGMQYFKKLPVPIS